MDYKTALIWNWFEWNLPQWVEDSFAVGPAAHDRLVLDGRQVGPLFERREEAGDGDHQPGGLQTTGGPEVPAESHSISILVLLNELLVGRHLRATAEKDVELRQTELISPAKRA